MVIFGVTSLLVIPRSVKPSVDQLRKVLIAFVSLYVSFFLLNFFVILLNLSLYSPPPSLIAILLSSLHLGDLLDG